MTTTESVFVAGRKSRTPLGRRVVFVLLALFSVFYFAETCLRASQKYFWYDELFTLYICRLPTFHAAWQAVLHGADFNPPLFYALTRASNAIFGDGLIGIRMPAMIGVWIFSLCLFRFVNRRFGLLAGFTAMVFPLLTGAYNYAYEARPHGVVLGFCGLALVCWQMMQERPREKRWLFGFSLSLAGGAFSHCYAVLLVVPFAIAETFSAIRSKSISWGRWTAMIIPAFASLACLVPLLQSYRAIVANTSFAQATAARWKNVLSFYVFLLSPSLVAIGVAVALLLLGTLVLARRNYNFKNRLSDFVLAASFLMLPFFGIALAKAIGGPFVPRYFLSAIIGLCILLGFAISYYRSTWVASAVTVVLLLSLAIGFFLAVKTARRPPLTGYPLLATQEALQPVPVVVPDAFDFLYLTYYDPALTPRLYYVDDESQNHTYFREVRFLRKLCRLNFNREYSVEEFTHSHPEFLLYGYIDATPWLSNYMTHGAAIRSLQFSGGHFLADLRMK